MPQQNTAFGTVLLLGKGGFGAQLAEWLLDTGTCAEVLFLDDAAPGAAGPLRGYGDAGLKSRCAAAFVPLGNNALRVELLQGLAAAGYQTPVFVHPAAVVSRTAALGPGCIVGPLAFVGSGAKAGYGCIVNAGAIVDHGAVLGDGVHVAPGAVVKAGAAVPDKTKIESGEIVFPPQR